MPDYRIRLCRRQLVSINPVSIGLASLGLTQVGLVALFLMSALTPAPAFAQVKRCERSDGTTAFTDRRCSAVDAVEREPSGNRPGSRRLYRGGCARNVRDLLFEVTTAVDAGDANRLASVYHWPGMSSSAATAVMTQLDAVVQRPLVDIVPVLPSTQRSSWLAADAGDPDNADGWASADAARASVGGPAVPTGGYQYPSTVNQTPIALRLIQTLDNGSTPSETVFDLHRHFGCVWIKTS